MRPFTLLLLGCLMGALMMWTYRRIEIELNAVDHADEIQLGQGHGPGAGPGIKPPPANDGSLPAAADVDTDAALDEPAEGASGEAGETGATAAEAPAPVLIEWTLAKRGFGAQITRVPVSLGQFRDCVAAGACAPYAAVPGPGCSKEEVLGAKAEEAMRCLDAKQADSFCRFIGGRLPSAAEWGRIYKNAEPPDPRTGFWCLKGEL